ncbi:MAG: hypothetical protein PHP43_03415 [Methanoculleus sp.]|nr:hypothetical protein [Methanoculleus sp.]
MVPTLADRQRILRRALVLVLLAVFALYLVLPAAFGIFAVLPLREEVGAPPEGFREVTIMTDEGIALESWYAPPKNGAAVILIHGAGSSREALWPYAAMLVRHGYGVLALDLVGHGGWGSDQPVRVGGYPRCGGRRQIP